MPKLYWLSQCTEYDVISAQIYNRLITNSSITLSIEFAIKQDSIFVIEFPQVRRLYIKIVKFKISVLTLVKDWFY